MSQRNRTEQATTDHEFIRDWVERRGGCPAGLRPGKRARRASVIAIDYPGQSAAPQELSPISWDEFFDRFEEYQLAFLYEDAKVRGHTRRFSAKLVGRSGLLAMAARSRR